MGDDLDGDFEQFVEPEYESADEAGAQDAGAEAPAAAQEPRADAARKDRKRERIEGLRARKRQRHADATRVDIPALEPQEQLRHLNRAYRALVGDDDAELPATLALALARSRGQPLVDVVQRLMPHWRAFAKAPRRPHGRHAEPDVIVVCPGALRATEVLRELKPLRCRVAKCFARHMKLAEQQQMLVDSQFPVAVGTPNRLRKLLGSDGSGEEPVLSLARCRLVVLDMAPTPKGFHLFSLGDTAADAFALLRDDVEPWIETGGTRVALVGQEHQGHGHAAGVGGAAGSHMVG